MDEPTPQPYWTFLFQEFIAESDPIKLKARLEMLESAIFERMQELKNSPTDDYEERVAIQMAMGKVLEIKTTKLGFPPVGD